MTTIAKMMVAVGLVATTAIAMAETKTTYRYAQGRIQGTVTTDRYGKTTCRDALGRIERTRAAYR